MRKLLRMLLFLIAGLLLLLLATIALLWRRDIPFDTLKAKYAAPPSQFAEVLGQRVHYRDEGQGMPLVLLHGTGASLHTWDDWMPLLKDYRVIRFDIPAYGLTGAAENHDYSPQRYVAITHALLQQLGVDSCYMAGNSLGGLITWQYAEQYPEQVKKMVLIDAAGFPHGKAMPLLFKMVRTPYLGEVLKKCSPRMIVENNLKEVYYDERKVTDELIDRYYELNRAPGNRDAFVARVRRHRTYRAEALQGIQTPALIMWGKHDLWIPVEDAYKFKAALPHAQVVVYDNAGHVPMEEIPLQSGQDFVHFLAE